MRPRSLPWLLCPPAVRVWVVPALFLTAAVAAQEPERERPDSAAAAAGSGSFRVYCTSCHGARARGDGEVAQYLKVKPADLTLLSQKNGGEFPFERVIETIDGRRSVKGHGRGEMPVWGDAFQKLGSNEDEARQRIEQLANYLWSIQE